MVSSYKGIVTIAVFLLFFFSEIAIADPKQQTFYPFPYNAYRQCLKTKCDPLFCIASDRNCHRQAAIVKECYVKNLNCQGFDEWEAELTPEDASLLPQALRLCLQQCAPDAFESESLVEIHKCKFNCAFIKRQSDL